MCAGTSSFIDVKSVLLEISGNDLTSSGSGRPGAILGILNTVLFCRYSSFVEETIFIFPFTFLNIFQQHLNEGWSKLTLLQEILSWRPEMKKGTVILILFIQLFFSYGAFGLEGQNGDVSSLDLDACIEIALANHPDLKAAEGELKGAESRIGQVEAGLKPQVGLSSSYTRQADSSQGDEDQYSSNVTFSQVVSDWGKTGSQKKIAGFDRDGSNLDLDQVRLEVKYNVEKVYYSVLKAQKNIEVAEESVNLYELHLKKARDFYEVGNVSKYDVTTAEVDLSNARLDLIKARTSLKTAKAELNNAMGFPDMKDYVIVDVTDIVRSSLTLDEALSIAMESRPDLGSSRLQNLAAEESIVLAQKDNAPSLSASGRYSWGGDDFTGEDDFSIGLSLQIPVYDGGLKAEKVKEARADLEVARARDISARNTALKEVQQAWMEYGDSLETLSTASDVVRQALENLELATGRYEVGVGSPIEVADATENYSNAQNSYWNALYEHLIAWATLEKTVGGNLQ